VTAPRRTVRIGLTGPIGCGKSTVGGWLAEQGVVLVDADAVARDVTQPGQPALAAVAERFGVAVLRPDGSLDRQRLAAIVFADADALAALESIVHPAVRPRILAAIEAAEAGGAPAVAIEAIRLVESGLATVCDEVWLVACDPTEQRQRLAGREMDEADAARRIAAQQGIVERLRPHATRVIETSGGVAETRARVEAALRDAIGGPG
jgi:dephospho-CoA kinase